MSKNKIKIDLDFDYLTILVREDKLEEIKNCYKNFAWEIISEKHKFLSKELVILKMRRPHKIKNKDKLQYLQVQLEIDLNKQSDLERNKHKKSTIYGLTFGFFSALVLALFVLAILNGKNLLTIIFGSVFGVIDVIANILIARIAYKIFLKENQIFKQKNTEISNQIVDINEKVASIDKGEVSRGK